MINKILVTGLLIVLQPVFKFSPLRAQEVLQDSMVGEATGDTIKPVAVRDTSHSPRKAALMSAVLPGLGQIYNRKWWKVPVIYGGLGALGYVIYDSNREMKFHLDQIRGRASGDPGFVDQFPGVPDEQLLSVADSYRRNRDLFIILSAGVYVLNILDAAVDAHLFNFDVSEDLAVNLNAGIMGMQSKATPVARIVFKF